MESKFIQDVEAFAQQMAGRLPVTNEGGIIIMATDNKDITPCIIAENSHRKDMLVRLFEDEDVQQTFLEIVAEVAVLNKN